jgi:16S rRNA (cytosine1402-N4)-methyltransferase
MGIWRYGRGAGRTRGVGDREPPAVDLDTEGSTVGKSPAPGAPERHTPVLLERCLQLLRPALAATGHTPVHVDTTLGLGGHAEAVLSAFPGAVLIGLDRDPAALALARARLAPYAERTHLVHAVSDELPEVLDELGYPEVDGALFDLGVSSMQLDEPERGFAYSRDTALDMRMDQSSGRTAEDVVNDADPAELTRILRVYGEERFASRIAAAIVRERRRARITSSARLADLVRGAIPAAARRTGGNPAKRTFQALRIEVNRELAALESALPAVVDRLAPGGRVVVLSYHSLEDRITKHVLAAQARSTAPVELPVEPPGTGPRLRLLTRGAELPDEAEVAANPRAASVRLRAAERIDESVPPATARRARRVRALHQPGPRKAPRDGDDGSAGGGPSTQEGEGR